MEIQPDITLKFEITEGRAPNVENVIAALAAWVDMTKAVQTAINPDIEIRIDLVEVEHGSQKFKFAIRRAQQIGNELTGAHVEERTRYAVCITS